MSCQCQNEPYAPTVLTYANTFLQTHLQYTYGVSTLVLLLVFITICINLYYGNVQCLSALGESCRLCLINRTVKVAWQQAVLIG